jgi:derlin-1
MSGSNDLGQWYNSIPRITRVWFTGSIIIPVAAALKVVYPGQLLLVANLIIKDFQVCFLFLNDIY